MLGLIIFLKDGLEGIFHETFGSIWLARIVVLLTCWGFWFGPGTEGFLFEGAVNCVGVWLRFADSSCLS